jgi:putative transposase
LEQRAEWVKAVRKGASMRAVARKFGVALRTIQRWVQRAGRQPLKKVDWASRPQAPRRLANKTGAELEQRICALRKELEQESALGFRGAQAIAEQMEEQGLRPVPSVRTIGRILARHGLLDARARVRRPAPDAGWYLPTLREGRAELDSFDVIEDLPLEGFGLCQVFTGRALLGAAVGAWPTAQANTTEIVGFLQEHWGGQGLPCYAQFDNDTRFQGGHNHPDVVGRVMRLCLALGVTPVFAPPLQQGFQGMIEHFNGLWQQKVWQRFHHASLEALGTASHRFTEAYQQRLARQRPEAPPRRPFPAGFTLDWQRPLRGQLIYLRVTDPHGKVKLLGHEFLVDPAWQHRLVRCEVDLDHHQIRCYRLRRKAPTDQPLLATHEHRLPKRPFLLPKTKTQRGQHAP